MSIRSTTFHGVDLSQAGRGPFSPPPGPGEGARRFREEVMRPLVEAYYPALNAYVHASGDVRFNVIVSHDARLTGREHGTPVLVVPREVLIGAAAEHAAVLLTELGRGQLKAEAAPNGAADQIGVSVVHQ